MIDVEKSQVQQEALRERLLQSEQMLNKATTLADNAYLSLSEGNIEACQDLIGELIHSISEHFYEEVH